ncbi:adult-specific rigid cuticular protein 15.7-like [Rhipicephalus sanguineus]|uniref:Cuticle protein n=1 Tax=Rhipicephalus sanguineus TaxID=34632 RepID=A0A9D4T1V1_RHISA|nr:adult-specific rigid cuticular protein 15.7-like [Rhipicephalus sanguineus]KAH7963568.1 hypothetical protein HPB52_021644 [Rhipicephalus sanguineus]
MLLATESLALHVLDKPPHADYEYYDVPQLPPAPTRYPSKTGRPYKFDYNIADHEGNQQYRIERADAQNTKTGAYGYRDVNGVFRHVNYIADRYGFRAVVNTNEPGTAPMDSADVVFNAAPIKVLPVKAPQHTVAAQNIWYAGVAKEYGGRYGLRNGVTTTSNYPEQRRPHIDVDHIGYEDAPLNSDYYYE